MTGKKRLWTTFSKFAFISAISAWFFSPKLALGVPLHVLNKLRVLASCTFVQDWQFSLNIFTFEEDTAKRSTLAKTTPSGNYWHFLARPSRVSGCPLAPLVNSCVCVWVLPCVTLVRQKEKNSGRQNTHFATGEIRPTLEYSSLALSSLSKTDAARLEKTRRMAARLIAEISLTDQIQQTPC